MLGENGGDGDVTHTKVAFEKRQERKETELGGRRKEDILAEHQ